MELYLVQHAQAKSKEDDPDRPLTESGRQDTLQVAEFAARLGVKVNRVRHSGKTRAEQTASILGGVLTPGVDIQSDSRLGPVDPVEPVGDELAGAAQSTMLIGHLPFMEKLAGYLLTGDAERAPVNFHNAALVRLVRSDNGWRVDWILTPRMAHHANVLA